MIKYKYCRDRDNRPLITVCEIDGLFRGVAICSPADNPCKAEGRLRAYQRAMAAAYSSKNQKPISRLEALQVLQDCGAEHEFKSEVL